jgi:hypothetical protein
MKIKSQKEEKKINSKKGKSQKLNPKNTLSQKKEKEKSNPKKNKMQKYKKYKSKEFKKSLTEIKKRDFLSKAQKKKTSIKESCRRISW